ncbi:MAG TPA: class I SAM-dependent methyltransferase [Vicinamibacterales bacterium]|nr:class I SAM-dependent methyltransferase [Vicinamibacterales bacterium]
MPEQNYYQQARREVAALVPEGAKRVLDVGCAEGILGGFLRQRGVAEVIGIEQVPEVAERAKANLTQVFCGDVSTMDLPFEPKSFDCIIFADVLEHLVDPLPVLQRYATLLADDGTIVVSIPNVRHCQILNMLAEGHWTYQDFGIMDRTHLRFFTLREVQAMVRAAGLEIRNLSANMDPQFETARTAMADKPLMDFTLGRVTIKGVTRDEITEMFAIQYLVAAQKALAA